NRCLGKLGNKVCKTVEILSMSTTDTSPQGRVRSCREESSLLFLEESLSQWLDIPGADFESNDVREEFDRIGCEEHSLFMRALSKWDLPQGDHPEAERTRAAVRTHRINAVIVWRNCRCGVRLRLFRCNEA